MLENTEDNIVLLHLLQAQFYSFVFTVSLDLFSSVVTELKKLISF